MADELRTWRSPDLTAQLPRWEAFCLRSLPLPLSLHPAWLLILESFCYSRHAVEREDSDWEPIPLELPVDDPLRRPRPPAGGDAPPVPSPSEDDDAAPRVVVIDLD